MLDDIMAKIAIPNWIAFLMIEALFFNRYFIFLKLFRV